MDSRDVAPSLPQSNPDADAVPDLLRRAVSGVLRNAQNGELPLFAWTLGMPQPELLALLARLFPEVDPVESMPDAQYQKLLRMCPPDFAAMLTLLLANRNPEQPERLTRWLAHAIAAACYGERELWEDLDLGGRDDLGQLLQQYFPPLHAGAFSIGLQTRPDQAAQAVQVARQVLQAFVRQGPTEAQLKAAKDNLIGGFALRMDSNASLLAQVSNIAWNGLPDDYLDTWTRQVEQVSASDVKAAFARVLQPERMVTVIVGPKTKAADTADAARAAPAH